MADAVITVDYVDWVTPREGFEEDGSFVATKVYRCAWEDRIQFMQELAGNWVEQDGVVVRYDPHRYPEYQAAWVVAVSCEGYPNVPKEKDLTYDTAKTDYALITTEYRIPNSDSSTGTTTGSLDIAHSIQTGVEILTLTQDERSLFWTDVNDQVHVETSPKAIIPRTVWTISVRNAAYLVSYLQTQAGIVNNLAIESKYLPPKSAFTFPAETLRYDGMHGMTGRDVKGNMKWDFSMTFVGMSPVGAYPSGDSTWNHAYRPGRSSPERMYTHATDRNPTDQYDIYPTGNLNLLLASYL